MAPHRHRILASMLFVALFFAFTAAQGADKCAKCGAPATQGGCKCNSKCNCISSSSSGSGCPSGWSPAVGTMYDSWPKPNTTECVAYSGCKWAGMFQSIDGGSARPCMNGAKWLDGGNGKRACRFPEKTVKSWNIAATYQLDSALLGKKLQIMLEGRPRRNVTVNVKDVCSDSDCGGCCKKNTGNKKWKLIDIEKWPASVLLHFNPRSKDFDINNVDIPSAGGLRPGAPQDSVMALCYRIVGPSDKLV